MESLDLLANNLANAATNGYKSDREFFSVYASADAAASFSGGIGSTMPVIERQWTDFSQGVLEVTGNPLDIALSKKGFLVVDGPTAPLYTRNGSLQVLSSGELASADGYTLRTAAGNSIRVASGKPIDILPDGTVRQEEQELGKIQIVDFKNTDTLKKAGKTYFLNSDPTNSPMLTTDTQVQQGRIETSNVSVAEASMRLVGVMRQFEMLQKAIGISGEMNSKTIQEVARVSP